MEWSDSWRGAFRIELRAEAIGYAWGGWPVLPGTYPAGSQWAGRSGAEQDGPVPVHADWQDRLNAKPEEIATWWTGQPYSLLVATGLVVDAIEVSADLGRLVARALRENGTPVPMAATPAGRWLFLTSAGQPLRPELSGHHDVRLHAKGSWIPLPPTPFQHGIVHWRVKPQVCGRHLPSSLLVQDAVLQAVGDPELFEPLHPATQLVTAERSAA
ncbi:bifunctional DNA primase/polymerase [Goodfellowiella coeruleoviolacea]|uniref:Bifunctional DNA primase/polymerase, N-terminal n=1 Tax=Goodfellowiella coeruleoviolacea TaxID=334858 RepID=A0AAE3GAP1_9PSEU|nr:bifunctional DNA primase/polymerase [Goodfellowiella coeruleoviolacea]MCP2164635.1 Bifunctional DNA primase/polymerase, N-terminal [Goodfellowiella coeruleoviolacea]